MPALPRPREQKARHRRQTPVEPVWLQDPAGRARHAPCRRKMAPAIARGEEASRGQGPVGVVVFDAWDLAADVVRVLTRRRQDGLRRRHTHRGVAPARVSGGTSRAGR